ncbi:MAG TPA: Rieske 2Fe-2S domain-containing protein [Chloroflexota bacterium]|nr:Rieske 2Fe-2S domain-containing protein [Chloroflexota bacterium]
MLTTEENERLTRVGPGTPGGELLRRYWQPVAGLNELTDQHPTKFVRVLGEDLVLFRDRRGHVGLLSDHCAHRGASLLYGRVEERGISCAYHGWLYDTEGNCLETPAEPEGSRFHLTVKQRAYPVEKLFGLYWAYLGPLPAPPIRRLDIMQYPIKEVSMEIEYQANWVQVVENNLDGSHIFVLHQDTIAMRRDQRGPQRIKPTNTTRGRLDDMASLEYREVEYGVRRRLGIVDGYVEDDLLVFPNMLRRMNMLSIKLPVDDTHTKRFAFLVYLDRGKVDDWGAHIAEKYIFPPSEAKVPVHGTYPNVRYNQHQVPFQDIMVIESQGPVSPRETWRAGTRDSGVTFLDDVLMREIDKVERGLDPLGLVRDPNVVIDTNIEHTKLVGTR